ncbi:MAG: exonuclease domain-containing protein [Thomasclavelia ramosa]
MSKNISINIFIGKPHIKRELKGTSIILLPNEYVILDLETTGLDPFCDEIIEISCLKIKDDNIISKYSTLVKPKYEILEFTTKITGITNEMVKNSPKLKQVLPELVKFIGNSYVVGYNTNFDINFLYDNSLELLNKPFINDFIDIMRFTKKLYPNLPNHKLKTICEHLQIDLSNHHRAEFDCLMVLECIKAIKNHININNIDYIDLFKYKCAEQKLSSLTPNTQVFDETHILYNAHCAFTGKLEKMERIQAMQKVIDFGGICDKSVTKNTNFLIVGSFEYSSSVQNNKSAKILKAEKLIEAGQNLKIISEQVFYDLTEL